MKYFSALFFSFLFTVISAQQADSIYYRTGFGTAVFKYQGKVLRPGKMDDLVRHLPEAKEEMRKAILNYNLYMPIGIAGGALAGWSVGESLAGAKMNYALFGAGMGLILVSLPVYNAYARHSVRAARIYNQSIRPTAFSFTDNAFRGTAIGLSLKLTF